MPLFSGNTQRMRRFILPYVAYLALPYFSTFLHKRHGSEKKKFEHKIFVLIFSTNLSGTFHILRRTERDSIKNVCRFRMNCPLFLLYFDETLNFLDGRIL